MCKDGPGREHVADLISCCCRLSRAPGKICKNMAAWSTRYLCNRYHQLPAHINNRGEGTYLDEYLKRTHLTVLINPGGDYLCCNVLFCLFCSSSTSFFYINNTRTTLFIPKCGRPAYDLKRPSLNKVDNLNKRTQWVRKKKKDTKNRTQQIK